MPSRFKASASARTSAANPSACASGTPRASSSVRDGPGIVSIGSGDTGMLSESLLVAFDTTVLGLIVAVLALCVSTVRKSWYTKYMAAFESATECVLELANNGHTIDAGEPGLRGREERDYTDDAMTASSANRHDR